MHLKSAVLAVPVLIVLAAGAVINSYGSSDEWTSSFDLDACTFSPNGSNAYFYLEPGYQLTLEGQEDGEDIQLILTVLNETRIVDGVETRTVEERESENGQIIEISRNYFAYCSETGDIFYFGEEVDIYEDGEIVAHEGAWLAGENNATPGIIIPAHPVAGMKYYQEVAPGVAEDRAEILSLNETLIVPAGIFEDVLKVEETTPLEPGVREYKYHAPGIGLIQDEVLKLVDYTIPEPSSEPLPKEMIAQLLPVEVGGETIEILVNSTAVVDEVLVDEQNKTVSFGLGLRANSTGTEDTTLISIGKILEGPYVVSIDGEVTDNVEMVSPPSGNGTAIRITHPEDSRMITVSGTSIVPEFPMLALLGVASAVGVVIVLSRTTTFKGISTRF